MSGHDDDPSSVLSERLLALIEEVQRQAADLPSAALDQLRRTVRGEFRIGVVGRVKAGKSTLVNALIGDEVAPTSAAERTRVVTEFRYGAPLRAQLVLRTGEVVPVPFRRGIPDELPRPPAEISHAEVFVPADPLRRFVLVDTPGLSTTTVANEAATRRAVLGDGDARSRVDALIYLFRDNEFRDDVEFLAEYGAARATEQLPAAILGALAHADEYGTGPWEDDDPLAAAGGRATAIAARHPEMTSVLPLAGRLAEAARLVLLTEADSRALAGLAAVPDDELEAGLMSDQATAVAERTRAAIGDYGLRFGRAPAAGGLRSLLAWLEEASGIGPLESALGEGAFGSRPEQRARSVLRELEQLALRSSSSITLRRAIHAVAAEPALLPMRAFEAREALHRAAPHHPMVEVLTRLLTERDPARRLGLGPAATDEETRQEALRLATSARRSAALTDATSEQDAAEAVAAWCRLELQRLETRAQPDGIRVRP